MVTHQETVKNGNITYQITLKNNGNIADFGPNILLTITQWLQMNIRHFGESNLDIRVKMTPNH